MINGFTLYKACRCGGSLNRRFQQDADHSNKYWIYPTKNQVRIFKENRDLGIYALAKLEDKLKEYGIII
jgi:hypothetical protein